MGMLGAFVFGYWMGTRAGHEGWVKLRDSAFAVLQSEEFKSTVVGAASIARGALQQGMEMALERA